MILSVTCVRGAKKTAYIILVNGKDEFCVKFLSAREGVEELAAVNLHEF